MAQYVLVHGGDRDGSIWKETSELLEKAGHRVLCPSMTSVTKASLTENIEEVISVITANDFDEIILVGHSYGAMVITGVNDRISEKISALIFVDSLIPENGKSLYGYLQELGLDYLAFGLTPDPACLEPLFFDLRKFNQKIKIYIRSLQSEFLTATAPVYQKILQEKLENHWTIFCLDAKHGSMFTHSQELAVIFMGAILLL